MHTLHFELLRGAIPALQTTEVILQGYDEAPVLSTGL
jgi:hypothetical protein